MKGFNDMGIFRESGSQTKIQEYKEKYEKGEEVNYDNEDPHTVAGQKIRLLFLFTK